MKKATQHDIHRKQWLFSPLGRVFLEQEKKVVSKLASNFFGDYLLTCGEAPFLTGLNESKITCKIWVDPKATEMEKCMAIRGRPDKLPITHDKIHLIYLAHCLGSTKNPHEVLRESYRVLVPEGHILISGFNPWSLWGVKRLFGSFVSHWPWNSHFLSVTRLKDWLALLGFELISTQFYFFRPPLGVGLEKLNFLEKLGGMCWPMLGGHYVMLAKKRIIPLTLIRPVWKQTEVGVEAAPGLLGPAVRDMIE